MTFLKWCIPLVLGLFVCGPRALFAQENLPVQVSRPNIFFILVDTLRPDHLGCYGYGRDTSPNIDQLAQQGLTFTNFYSTSSWTNPAVASIFTGFYPQAIHPPAEFARARKQILPDTLETLAEILTESGYQTTALVDHPMINPNHHYDQGFSDFVMFAEPDDWLLGGKAEEILRVFTEKVNQQGEGPFFIYLHLLYPHEPYNPPAPYDRMFGQGFEDVSILERSGVINVYDGEVRYTDQLVGDMVAFLREKALLENTYIFLTSDHGEGFWEHFASGHGNTLYNELLKIPMIIYPPGGGEARSVPDLAGIIDVFPTILEIAGIKRPGRPGKSLLGYLKGQDPLRADRILFAESPTHSPWYSAVSLVTSQYKIIYNTSQRIEVYDLLNDAPEKNELSANDYAWFPEMLNRLLRHKEEASKMRLGLPQRDAVLEPSTIKRLKSLGYLH